MRPTARELEERVGFLLAGLGFDLVELKVIPERGRVIIRIYLDTRSEDPARGVTHRDCAAVSREIGDFLEGEGLLEGNYTLEVSSPGVDRPLVEGRHFRRNLGRLVEVRGRDPEGRSYVLIGRLAEAEAERIKLEIPGESARELALAEIVRARVMPEFRRPGRERG